MCTPARLVSNDLSVPVLQGTCTTCHDTPYSGNHSIPAPLDIGLTDASRCTPDLPLYTLRHNLPPFEAIQTTDPGRALITGKWNDIGRFKGPILRALATRAPYFRNGSAQNLDAVVDFYNQRFDIGLTHEAKADLIAFLLTLWMTGPNPRVQNGVQPDRGDPRPDESTATEPAACYGVSRSSAPWPR